MKKRPSFVSTKQKIVAIFTVTMMLLQICLPTAVWAASLLSNESITAAMSSQAFRKSSSNAYLYEQASFDDASYVGSQNIKSFRERLVANKINLGKPTFVPIGSDITIFIPTYPTGKLIGDAYVQNRYIRQQVFDLLGRHLIYAADKNTSDVAQINTLYENAFIFAKAHPSINFGANLDATIRDEISKDTGIDMIWPEVRIINNESVVVPVVYLKTTTINDNKVTKTITEFVGSAVTLGSITLDHAVLTLGANTMLKTKNNITLSKDSLIASGGDVNLVVGGTLNLIGSKITGTKDVNIIAKEVNVKAVVVPFQDRYGSGTKLGSVSSVNATTGNISIRSTGGDITFEASTATASNGSITLNSAANISIQPVFLSYQGDSSYGAWIINNSSVNIVGSKLSSRDTISLYAEGAITITSSELISTQGGIELLAQQGIYVLDEQGNTQVNRQKIKGRTKGTSSDFNTWAVRSVLNAGKGVLMDTEAGDITLRAAKISSTEGTGVYARNGKVHLLVTKEQSQHYLNMVRKGTWTIKTKTEEDIVETPLPNSIVGGFSVEALHGVNVEYTGKKDSTLAQQIAEYEKMPDMKWMATLYNNGQVNGNVSWDQVELVYKHIHESNTSLSPAAMAIIAIAVCVAMGPAGAGWIGSGGTITAVGPIAGPVLSAGATTLATSAAQNLAAGKGLEGTLKAITSDDSLKNLAISMATAGAMSYLKVDQMTMFGDSAKDITPMQNLGNQAYQAVVSSTVSAGISVTVNGGNLNDYKKAFTQGLAVNAINTLGEKMAHEIGIAFDNGSTLQTALKYIAHAGSGCIVGTLSAKANGEHTSQGACYAGAGGAVVGEIIASNYRTSDEVQNAKNALDSYIEENGDQVSYLRAQGYTNQEILNELSSRTDLQAMMNQMDQLRQKGVDLSKLGAAISAFAAGANASNINVAATMGETTAENNALALYASSSVLTEAIDSLERGAVRFVGGASGVSLSIAYMLKDTVILVADVQGAKDYIESGGLRGSKESFDKMTQLMAGLGEVATHPVDTLNLLSAYYQKQLDAAAAEYGEGNDFTAGVIFGKNAGDIYAVLRTLPEAAKLAYKIRAKRTATDTEVIVETEIATNNSTSSTVQQNNLVGNSFDEYVAATKLKALDELGLLERQERLPTPDIDGRNYVKPDYTIYNTKGEVVAYADAKAGLEIPFDAQARGLIEWSKTTKTKALIYYTPQGTTPISPYLLNYARQAGVVIKQVGVK